MEYVKVVPANAEMAKLLKHPSGVAFRDDPAVPVPWPHDQFTMRRLRDGDIKIFEEDEPASKPKAKRGGDVEKDNDHAG